MLPLTIDPKPISSQETSFVSNLPPITPSPTMGINILSNQWLGVSFTTNNEVYLNSANLFLVPIENGLLFLKLLQVDGTEIISFTVPNIQSAAQHLFTATNLVLLESNTTYWLVAGISASGSGNYIWAITNSTTEAGLLGWSIGNAGLYSTNQGSTWNFLTQGGTFQFRINGYQL